MAGIINVTTVIPRDFSRPLWLSKGQVEKIANTVEALYTLFVYIEGVKYGCPTTARINGHQGNKRCYVCVC